MTCALKSHVSAYATGKDPVLTLVEEAKREGFRLGSTVVTFRLSTEDRARLNALLTRERATLGGWIRRRIAEADAPAGVPAHVPAQARAVDEEARALRAEVARLREEAKAAVVLSPDAMAILEPLFRQCAGKWPQYRGPGGFAEWLGDAAFGFLVLNAHALGLDLGQCADGALSTTPMLRALVCQSVRDLVLGKQRYRADEHT